MSTLLLVASLSLPLETNENHDKNLVETNKVMLLSEQVLQELSIELTSQQKTLEAKISAEIRQGVGYRESTQLFSAMK